MLYNIAMATDWLLNEYHNKLFIISWRTVECVRPRIVNIKGSRYLVGLLRLWFQLQHQTDMEVRYMAYVAHRIKNRLLSVVCYTWLCVLSKSMWHINAIPIQVIWPNRLVQTVWSNRNTKFRITSCHLTTHFSSNFPTDIHVNCINCLIKFLNVYGPHKALCIQRWTVSYCIIFGS